MNEPLPSALPHVTIDRQHSFSGKKNLDWFFANRRWVRITRSNLVEAAWAVRELPLEEAPLRFLFLAPKRFYKPAHDRNKIRRLLRAAIAEEGIFAAIEQGMHDRNQQLLVMMRITKPIMSVKWEQVLDDVRRIAGKLSEC